MGPPLQSQSESESESFASGGGRRCKSRAEAPASGGGRRYKGISSAAWFRVLLQHAGAVHPCTARTKSPCSDVLRGLVLPASAGCSQPISYTSHSRQSALGGIDEATDIHMAKDAVVRGSGASRPWMACARLLEPRTAQPGDAPDPRITAAPAEASETGALHPHCRGSPRSDAPDPRTAAAPSRSRQTPALFKLAGSGIPQSGEEPGKWVRDARRSPRLQPAPAKPAWRQASNTTTATALDRFRLRLCGRIGSRSSRSGGSASRISCGRPRVSGPNRKASPSA